MRKFFCALCAVLLCCMLPVIAEENLIVNGGFAVLEGSLPAGWSKEVWYTDHGVSTLESIAESYDGAGIAVINASENDARFAQTVAVEPDSVYRISCMCRAEGVGTDMIGATISIKDTFTYSESLYDTNGEWLPLELYGLTGPDQTELTVYARVGGYGNLNTGSAWFDNFEMVEIDEIPEGVFVESFAPNSSSDDDDIEFGAETAPARNTEMYVLLTCIYMLVVLAFTKKHRRRPEHTPAFYRDCMFIMLCAAFLLRAVLAVAVPGYNTDINCFTGWSGRMFKLGPANFYSPDYFCDYPPGYMLMLWPVGAIQSLFGIASRSGAHLLLLKLWPILFDLAAAWLIWHTSKHTLGHRGALLMAAFFAFNPAVFTNSAAWGQIDSVYTLLIALCALLACEESYIPSLLCFALSMLVKPQALLFAPLGLLTIVIFCCRSDDPAKAFIRLGLGVLAALAAIYAVVLLCCFDAAEDFIANLVRPVTWLVELYGSTMQGYSYVTVNTLNLYYLLDLNWARTEDHSLITLIAWICFGASYVYCAALCLISKNRRHLPLIGGLLIVLICTFGPMIHERYVFPAILLLALGYIFARDKRLLLSMTVLSAALFLNEVLVLQGGMTEANFGHLQSSEDWLNFIVSFINVLNALFLAWTAWDICVFDRIFELHGCAEEALPAAGRDPFGKSSSHHMKLKRVDVLLMAAVTLAYSVVAFTNLGSTKAPQTSWISSASDEQIEFDLGSEQRFRMTYYGGICSSNFTVELSNDGEVWTEPYYAKYNQGEIFRWLWYVPMDENESIVNGTTVPTEDGSAYVTFIDTETHPFQTARYVRLTTTAAGLVLSEVAFLDENSEVLPIRSVSGPGDVHLLTDEQDTVGEYPSYYNSSYFDEIYHARTAYEHLHGMNTYEWTHPPLGKVLMMVGIQLFGMTPFGWRFMGALMGVLMLPLMYLLVKQLTKSTKMSFIAMFLMSVDSMHFTQTRIATIDSYSVFWIMLMYFFMFRYCQMRWTTTKDFLRSLVVLGLCGVTMGIAWATKWIGLYASAGLAILFFWTLWRHFREFRRMEALNLEPDGSFWKYAGITVGFCLVFFVAIPVLIYYFSYYWHLQSHGVSSIWNMFSAKHVKTIVDLQKSIFGYHAGLGGDTHYFRSEWYEWPIIWWPMWYFSGTTYMPDGVISSISCMGNPAVWWFGLAALIFVIVRMCFTRRAPVHYAMVVIGFASQFLPWVIVPRSTFIYHYFASVPFIIIASVLFLKWIERRSKAAFKTVAITLCAAALILFIAFYPLESGLPVARAYANYLRWFNWYNF